MNQDEKYDISSGVVARNLSGEMVILDLENGIYFGLNAVGSRIWELLGEGRTVGEILAAIPREYDVTAADAEKDALDLLAELKSRGLIERADG